MINDMKYTQLLFQFFKLCYTNLVIHNIIQKYPIKILIQEEIVALKIFLTKWDGFLIC